MQTVACIALKDGMILAKDVRSHKDEILAKTETILHPDLIQKLIRYNIVCVDIKDAEDLADTHFKRVQASTEFRQFSDTYNYCLQQFRIHLQAVINSKHPVSFESLRILYENCIHTTTSKWQLLDFLYNKMPSDDEMTYAHCFNSALISGVFADWLRLSESEKQTLIDSAFCYDIGKLLIPDAIIWKSGKLTDLEYTQMKTHTIKGFQLLQEVNASHDILKAALSHHEKCDGTGYPSRLKSNQISMYAKIIAIVDAYEAMTSARTYRTPMNPFHVINILEKDGYQIYDISYLLPILKNIANTQIGQRVRLSDGRTATVMLINENVLSKPILKTDQDILIDLNKERNLEIEINL